jgi:hypothetical protein
MNPKELDTLLDQWDKKTAPGNSIASTQAVINGGVTSWTNGGYVPGPIYTSPNTTYTPPTPDPRITVLEMQIRELRDAIDRLGQTSESTKQLVQGFVTQVRLLEDIIRELRVAVETGNAEPLERLTSGDMLKQIQNPEE